MIKLKLTKLDGRGWQRKIDAFKSRDPKAGRQAAGEMAAAVCEIAHLMARKDTHRYARALAQIGNKTGYGSIPVDRVEPSRFAGLIEQRLEEQVQKFDDRLKEDKDRLERWYPGGPPRNPKTGYYHELNARIRRNEKLLARSKEELEKVRGAGGESALLIGGFFGVDYRQQGRALATVRIPIYGGDVHYVLSPGRTMVVMHNKEPHASFVEKRDRTTDKAIDLFRMVGVRRVARKYVKDAMADFRRKSA